MARLPKPGGDAGNWGQILNDFLSQTHKEDGQLKDNVITKANIAPGAVSATELTVSGGTDGQVLVKDANVQGGMVWRTPGGSGTVSDASTSTKGVVRLAGDLGGTADNPTVPGLAGKANSADVYTRAQADSLLSGKANSADVMTRTQVEAEFIASSQKGANNGVASLDASGKVPAAQLPATTAPVSSVAGKTGAVVLSSADVGLANVNNTSDANKPISTATQTALDGKAATNHSHSLDALSDVSASGASNGQSLVFNNGSWAPATVSAGSASIDDASTTTKGVVRLAGDLGGTADSPTVPGLANKADVSALNAKADASALANYVPLSQKGANNGIASLDASGKVPAAQLPTTSAPVTSVAGRTGAVTLTAADVGLSNVNNTSDANKPISTATQTALDGKASTTHTHTVAQVTGLQAALDGKASTTHAHTLDSLSDVTAPSATNGQALLYNNGSWAPGTVSAGGTVSDATTSAKGIVRLAGDLGGTADSPTVPGLAAKADTSALANYVPTSQLGVAGGVATLASNGRVQYGQLSGVAAMATSGGAEAITRVTSSTATTNLSVSVANIFDVTLNATTTAITPTNVNNNTSMACAITVYLNQGTGGNKTVTWPNVKWSGGAPTLSTAAGAIDVVVLESINGGGSWFGSLVGTNFQ